MLVEKVIRPLDIPRVLAKGIRPQGSKASPTEAISYLIFIAL